MTNQKINLTAECAELAELKENSDSRFCILLALPLSALSGSVFHLYEEKAFAKSQQLNINNMDPKMLNKVIVDQSGLIGETFGKLKADRGHPSSHLWQCLLRCNT